MLRINLRGLDVSDEALRNGTVSRERNDGYLPEGSDAGFLLAPNRPVVILAQYQDEEVGDFELLENLDAPLFRDLNVLMRHEGSAAKFAEQFGDASGD